jgi:hypothetical protein
MYQQDQTTFVTQRIIDVMLLNANNFLQIYPRKQAVARDTTSSKGMKHTKDIKVLTSGH